MWLVLAAIIIGVTHAATVSSIDSQLISAASIYPSPYSITAGTYTDCTINGGDGLLVNLPVNLVASGGTVIIDCQSLGGRALTVTSAAPGSIFTGFTFANGNAATASTQNGGQQGGGGALVLGSTTFNTCSFTGNSAGASGVGGGILTTAQPFVMNNCIVSGNSATTGDGGGMYLTQNVHATITATSVVSNTAQNGGGVYFKNTDSGTFNNCLIQGNSATVNGGGFDSIDASITFNNVNVFANTAAASGGAMSVSAYATLNNVTVSGNSGQSVINMQEPSGLVLFGSTVKQNTATVNYVVDCPGSANAQVSLISSTLCSDTTTFCQSLSPFCYGGANINSVQCSYSCTVSASNTASPTRSPSVTPSTSKTPTVSPSVTPTSSVTRTPSASPSVTPSVTPTSSVTPSVTPSPSKTPSVTPSMTPTPSVTPTSSVTPSISSTPTQSRSFSSSITSTPTVTPTPVSISPSPSNLFWSASCCHNLGGNVATAGTQVVVHCNINAASVPASNLMITGVTVRDPSDSARQTIIYVAPNVAPAVSFDTNVNFAIVNGVLGGEANFTFTAFAGRSMFNQTTTVPTNWVFDVNVTGVFPFYSRADTLNVTTCVLTVADAVLGAIGAVGATDTSSDRAALIGGLVGGFLGLLACLALCFLLWCCLRRRKKRQQKEIDEAVKELSEEDAPGPEANFSVMAQAGRRKALSASLGSAGEEEKASSSSAAMSSMESASEEDMASASSAGSLSGGYIKKTTKTTTTTTTTADSDSDKKKKKKKKKGKDGWVVTHTVVTKKPQFMGYGPRGEALVDVVEEKEQVKTFQKEEGTLSLDDGSLDEKSAKYPRRSGVPGVIVTAPAQVGLPFARASQPAPAAVFVGSNPSTVGSMMGSVNGAILGVGLDYSRSD